jgi:hypothetical protein
MSMEAQIKAEIEEERRVHAEVKSLAAQLARAAGSMWMWGDGCGGYVREVIEAAFDAERLPRPVTRRTEPSRPGLNADQRGFIFARDGLHCQSCGGSDNLTVDHIIPIIKGGTDDPDNLQTLCRSCNCRKGGR